MKDVRNVRHHRAEGARWRPAALLLAAVLIAVSVPFFGKSVFADDLEPVNIYQDCSLTVDSNGIDMQDKENVVVDLYRVAYLIPDEMYDTYHWAPTSVLDGLITLPEYTDREGWKAVTEDLADLILGIAPESQKQWEPSDVGGLADSFTDYTPGDPVDATSYIIRNVDLGKKVSVPSGFYMIIARGKDVNKYICRYESGENDPEHMTRTVTLAKSDKLTYLFAAEMIAVPTRDMEGAESNTANPVKWEYNPTVYLKAGIRKLCGDLVIIKDLELYEYRKKEIGDNPRDIKDNATFVFEVTAYESEDSYKQFGDAARIYNNYITINFNDESGTKNALVKDLPVGAYVIVKEVYSGRSYTETVKEKAAVIQPDDVSYVDFENKYDKTQGGGGSFVNNFKYTDETGWEGNRVDDNSTGSTVVKPFNKD